MPTDTEKIIKEVDHTGSGKINYTEFIAATIDLDLQLSEGNRENKMKAIF